MSELTIGSAGRLSPAEIAELYNATYAGYAVPFHLDEATTRSMIQLFDLDLERSVVGWLGERPVAMAMLGLRPGLGWIGGMGVLPELRGRGYGAQLMRAAIEHARAAGARAVDLEVIEANTPAIRIYEALGFGTTRRLVVWLVEPNASAMHAGLAPDVVPIDTRRALESMGRWSLGPTPWQRSLATIAHLPEPPVALGYIRQGELAGAIVFRATGERVSVLALSAHQNELQATLDALLGGVRARHPAASLRMLNMPVDDPGMDTFERLNARAEVRQIEMRLPLI